MKKFILFICFFFTSITVTFSKEICEKLRDASIFAQDNSKTFLGVVANSYDSKSIFNEYGSYGSEYSSESIWNDYGSFGGEYSSYSPFNTYTSTPPMFIKNGKVIGYLSSNEYIEPSISPDLLKSLCKDMY